VVLVGCVLLKRWCKSPTFNVCLMSLSAKEGAQLLPGCAGLLNKWDKHEFVHAAPHRLAA